MPSWRGALGTKEPCGGTTGKVEASTPLDAIGLESTKPQTMQTARAELKRKRDLRRSRTANACGDRGTQQEAASSRPDKTATTQRP